MIDESLDAGFPLISNQGVLGKFLKNGIIRKEHELKVGKSKMRYPSSFSGLQTLIKYPLKVLSFYCSKV
jgi:hypothetical protein